MEPLHIVAFSIAALFLTFFTTKLLVSLILPPSASASPFTWLWRCAFSSHMPSLQGKHVFITGASSGIGLAIARSSLQQGAFVTMVARGSDKLRAASKLLLKATECTGDRINVQVADVGDFSAISEAVAASLRWRPIDVIVCNAGITQAGYLEHTDIRDVDKVIRTNVNGTVYALHQALPSLKEWSMEDRHSHPVSIVLISSLASVFFMYGHAVYTASKYALRGLAEGLRAELLPYKNIKVTVINPGFVDTAFLEEATEGEEIAEMLGKVNMLSRGMADTPQHVAACTLDAVKKGRFMVGTQVMGAHLLLLGRGVVPPDTLLLFALELLLAVPCRVFSLFVDAFNHLIIVRGARVPYKPQH